MAGNYSYYQKLWQKSLLLEIIDTESHELKQSFAFSLPPESIRIQVPQRVATTKTFGGLFVDDYGVDSAHISIAGSTGNTMLKEVYLNGQTVNMTGKNEAYFILEEIMHYKKGKQYEKFELRLYDLSSVPNNASLFGQADLASLNIDGWIVVLKDGQIERSKDKPLFFNYSLEFIGVEPLGTKKYSIVMTAIDKSIPFQKMTVSLETTKTKLATMKKKLSGYETVIAAITNAEQATNDLEAKMRSYYRVVQGWVDTAMGAVNSIYEIASFPYDLLNDLVQAANGLRDSIFDDAVAIMEGFDDLSTKYLKDIPELWNSLFDVEEQVANVKAVAESIGLLPAAMIVPAGSSGAMRALGLNSPETELDVGVLLTYGSYTITATSETRLDSLSMSAYGTPDYADTLATFNGIVGDSATTPGMQIKIPYLSYSQAQQFTEVYSHTDSVLGTDIALTDGDDLSLGEFNDYQEVSGLDNISQAINLRLAEKNGARLRLEFYGINMAEGGYDSFSLAIMLTSIRETLLKDPRITGVNDFSARVNGDSLMLNFAVELEAGGNANFTIIV